MYGFVRLGQLPYAVDPDVTMKVFFRQDTLPKGNGTVWAYQGDCELGNKIFDFDLKIHNIKVEDNVLMVWVY